MILQFQKIVALSKAFLIFQRRLFRLLDHPLLDIAGHLPGKTSGKRNDPLMKLPQHLHIHPRPVVIPFRMSAAHDFHQILIPFIVLRQKYQMVIPIIAPGYFPVKSGVRRNIHLAPQDRIDPLLLTGAVKINDAVHYTMVRNSGGIHPQLLHPFHIFFYLIGTV